MQMQQDQIELQSQADHYAQLLTY